MNLLNKNSKGIIIPIIIFFFISSVSFAQGDLVNISVRVVEVNHSFQCCNDVNANCAISPNLPEPRYRVRARTVNNGSATSGYFAVKFIDLGDNVACGSYVRNDLVLSSTGVCADEIALEVDMWEEDGCGLDATFNTGCASSDQNRTFTTPSIPFTTPGITLDTIGGSNGYFVVVQITASMVAAPILSGSSATDLCLDGEKADLFVNTSQSVSSSSFRWYTQETGGSLIFVGSNYEPTINRDSTVWVQYGPGFCATNRTRVDITQTMNEHEVNGDTTLLCTGTVNIDLSSSDNDVNYYLRNDLNDSVVAGPVVGNGGAISFNGFETSSTETYNVMAKTPTSALNFDGLNDFVDCGNDASLVVDTAITMAAWVYPTGTSTYSTIFNKEGEYEIGLLNGELALAIDNTTPGWNWVYSGYDVPLNEWTHVATTYDAGTGLIIFYVNGEEVQRTAGSGFITDSYPAQNDFWIGWRESAGSTTRFTGSIDEVSAWNVARDSSQILDEMNNCLVGNEVGLMVYFTFETGNYTTVYDRSSNANDGILTNMDQATDWVNGVDNCTTCFLEMSEKVTITVDPINTQTLISSADSVICAGDSVSLSLSSSQVNLNYYLYASDSTLLEGPIAGTDGLLPLKTLVIHDSSSYFVEANTTYDTTYRSGYLQFDGIDDRVQSSMTTLTDEFTIEALVKFNALGKQQGIITRTVALASQNFGWHLNLESNNKLKFHIGMSGSERYTTSSITLDQDVWYHVAAQYDGTNCVIYVDGVDVSEANAGSASGDVINIGNLNVGFFDGVSSDAYLDGSIDEVRIWQTVRTASEINDNIMQCLDGTESGLVSYYQCEDGTGSTLLSDLTGSNIGILVSFNVATAWIDGTETCGFPTYSSECEGSIAQKTIYVKPVGSYSQQPTDVNACLNNEVFVTCAKTGVLDNLIWQLSTDNGASWNDLTLPSSNYSGTEDSLHISSITNLQDGYLFRNRAIKCGVAIDTTSAATLTILQPISYSQNISECYGETINGNYYDSSQVIVDTLVGLASNGCDSIVTTTFTVLQFVSASQNLMECEGITINGTYYDSTQTVVDTLFGMAGNGCDSILTTNLTILPHAVFAQNISACDTATINGNVYTTSQVVIDTLTGIAANTCDSIVTTTLTILEPTLTAQNMQECDSAVINGTSYYVSQTVTDVFSGMAGNGCDSIVTTELTINQSYSIQDTQQIAMGDSIFVGGAFQTSAGLYSDLLTSSENCDSVIVTIVELINGISNDLNTSIKVYPNPVQDLLTIESSYNEIGRITLRDAMGRIVYSENKILKGRHVLDFSSLPNGLYILRVQSRDQAQIFKKITK